MLENAQKNMEKIAPVEIGEPCPECGAHLSFVVDDMESLSHVVDIQHVNILKKRQKEEVRTCFDGC